MSDQDILIHIKRTLKEMAFEGILKAYRGDAKMVAFILASCFIDYLAGFWVGRETRPTDYKNFVQEYLKSYDPESLYKDLRCRFVHNYSAGDSYIFVDGKRSRHLSIQSGKTIINLENFLDDIKLAMERLFNEFDTDANAERKALRRYSKIGLLTTAPLDSI